jgi:membrane dipeptidase
VLIVDTHLDLAWNALQWERDLTRPVTSIRVLEAGMSGKSRGLNTVALPEMRQGRVGLCVATLLARSTGRTAHNIDYGSVTQAQAVARGQLAYYRALEGEGLTRVIDGRAKLKTHLQEWQAWGERHPEGASTDDAPPIGLVISMESADGIAAPQQLEEWYGLGVRLIGPTHYGPGRYAGGTGTDLGLTDLGTPLLAEMQRLGVALDLTHFSDTAFWEALEVYEGPVLASHQNARALVPNQRQFSDAQLNAIIKRGGVIGAALDAFMLRLGWDINGPSNLSIQNPVTLRDVVDQIDHVCQLAGSTQHAAIGSDLDGGFGREQSPRDLNTIADLQKIPALLLERGYSASDVAAIMHGNASRFLMHCFDHS